MMQYPPQRDLMARGAAFVSESVDLRQHRVESGFVVLIADALAQTGRGVDAHAGLGEEARGRRGPGGDGDVVVAEDGDEGAVGGAGYGVILAFAELGGPCVRV